MSRAGRAVVLVVALMALTLAGGCMFVDATFSVSPDGSRDARMEAGVLKSMAEQGEGDFTTDINENLVQENWTELDEFDRGKWRVKAWEGHAGPGQKLFAAADGPNPQFGTQQHALSTVYTFEMPLPEGPVMGPTDGGAQPPTQEQEGEGAGDNGAQDMQQMNEAMGQMMQAMMSSGDAGLRFSVDLPGEVMATNGQLMSPANASWRIDLTAQEMPYDMLTAKSRLPNWPVVGKLAGQMTQMGRWDLVPALIAGVRRGVLPDPVSDDPMSAELDTIMYVQAVEIMMTLDQVAGEQIANQVMGELGITGDPDPAAVEEIAVQLEGIDLGRQIDRGVTEQLLNALGGG